MNNISVYEKLCRNMMRDGWTMRAFKELTIDDLNQLVMDGVIGEHDAENFDLKLEGVGISKRRFFESMVEKILNKKIFPMLAIEYKKELSEVVASKEKYHLPQLARQALCLVPIWEYQEENNYSDEEMCSKLGCSSTAYRAWRIDMTTPYFDRCVEMFKRIGLDINIVFDESVKVKMSGKFVGVSEEKHECNKCGKEVQSSLVFEDAVHNKYYICLECSKKEVKATMDVTMKYE